MTAVAPQAYPFDGSTLSNADWEDYAGLFRSDGVIRGAANELAVSQHAGTPGMSVDIATGAAFLRGTRGNWSTVSTLTIANNSAGNPRLDLVVAVLDVSNSQMYLDVVQGTAAASPSVPALTANSALKQMALAKVAVAAGATSIVNANLTDLRWAASGPGGARGFALPAAAALTLYPDTEHPSLITLPVTTTGTAITSITAAPAGSHLCLEASGAVSVTAGSNLKMAESWSGGTQATLSLVSDGTNWVEVARAAATGTAGLVLAAPETTSGLIIQRALGPGHLASGGLYYPNPVINGGFAIWQRGTSFNANGAFTADRWQLTVPGASAASVSRSAFPDYGGAPYCLAIAVSAVTSGAVTLVQVLENPGRFATQTITVSARVWADTASLARLALTIVDSSGTQNIFSSYALGNSTWQTLSLSYPVIGAATAISVYLRNEAIGGALWDNVLLAPAASAQRYYEPEPADELARCQRYYQRLGGVMGAFYTSYTAAGASEAINCHVSLPVRMYGTPSITMRGASGWTSTNCADPTVQGPWAGGFTLESTSGGAGVCVLSTVDATTYVECESNP